MKGIAILTVTISLYVLSVSLAFPEQVVTRHPFVYHYEGRDRRTIDKLDAALRGRLMAIEDSIGVKLEGAIQIHLTLSRDEFQSRTGGRVPVWAGGVAYSAKQTIILKDPIFFGQGVPLDVLAAHELAHILTHRAAGGNYTPRWLEEGIAIKAAREVRSGQSERLNRAVAADALIALPRVDGVLGFSAPMADLAYAEAGSAVQLILEWYGWRGIRGILSAVKDGLDFEDAFFQATGLSYEQFQIDWFDFVRNRYRWGIFLEVDFILWTGIVLLGVTAMMVAYFRRRRMMKRLGEVEATGAFDFDDESEFGEYEEGGDVDDDDKKDVD